MKKIYQKISKIFESRATVFFATLALMLGTFYCLEKYEKLISNQNNTNRETKESLLKPTEALAYFSNNNMKNPECLDNYESWKSSKRFKADAPWSTAFMEGHFHNTTVQISGHWTSYRDKYYFNNFDRDLNGDGLPDYVYVYHAPSNDFIYTRDCVYLSNGRGWDLAYRCVTDSGKFYGDCAG